MFRRMTLPHQNFGKVMSDLVTTDVHEGNMGNNLVFIWSFTLIFKIQPTDYDGFVIFIRAIFGHDTALLQKEKFVNATKGSHPVQMAENFNPFPAETLTTPFDIIDHNTEGLAKLLMYNDYVKAKMAILNGTMNANSIVNEELDKYPYKRKEEFVPPNLSANIILSNSDNLDFHAALTDAGICHVLNGQSLGDTNN